MHHLRAARALRPLAACGKLGALRQFASPGFRLWNLGFEAKIIYSFFLVASLAALGVSVLLAQDMRVLSPSRAAAYYHGRPHAAAPPPGRGPAGGPDIAVPAEEEARLAEDDGVSYRRLLEVTHFHLFTVPVFVLILGHLFAATAARRRLPWVLALVGSSALHLVAPWWARSAPGLGAPLHVVSGAVLLVSSGWMCALSLLALWRPERRRTPSPAA